MIDHDKPSFGSLFAGIGGFDLGFERAGWECRWQVEIDPFCRKVLTKHWPGVPKHDDVRTFPPDEGDWYVDAIIGGFPCQDISNAGPKIGIGGARSGLWTEYARCIGVLRPRFVVVENVPVLRSRGLDRILGDLASLGYDAEWDCIPASVFGAPHQRDRFYLVAHPQGQGGWSVAGSVGSCSDAGVRNETGKGDVQRRTSERQRIFSGIPATARECQWWAHQPGLGRLVHGISGRLVIPRNHAAGNAIVPQVAEYIGRQVMIDLLRRHDA